MKKHNLWNMLLNRFFIWFNLTTDYERPSKDKNLSLHKVRAIVLPDKQTVMNDEFSGFTKTKLQIQEVYKGHLDIGTIVEITEPYYESYYRGKKSIIVHEGYEPLEIGASYTFVLSKDSHQMMPSDDQGTIEEGIFCNRVLCHRAS